VTRRPRRPGRRPDDWRDTGEDDHFAGDAYFARWLDEPDPTDPDDDLWPRRREVLSPDIKHTAPVWWRIWRWWR
jgi:hypothetical protein